MLLCRWLHPTEKVCHALRINSCRSPDHPHPSRHRPPQRRAVHRPDHRGRQGPLRPQRDPPRHLRQIRGPARPRGRRRPGRTARRHARAGISRSTRPRRIGSRSWCSWPGGSGGCACWRTRCWRRPERQMEPGPAVAGDPDPLPRPARPRLAPCDRGADRPAPRPQGHGRPGPAPLARRPSRPRPGHTRTRRTKLHERFIARVHERTRQRHAEARADSSKRLDRAAHRRTQTPRPASPGVGHRRATPRHPAPQPPRAPPPCRPAAPSRLNARKLPPLRRPTHATPLTRPAPAANDRDPQPGEARPQMDARAKAASLAIWCRPVEPEPVGGGITNANFLVDDGQRRCFVRVGDDIPVHHILRWHELAASRAAHAAGISPAVLHAEPGVLVLDLIEGRTLGPADVRERRQLARIVPLLRLVHTELPRSPARADPGVLGVPRPARLRGHAAGRQQPDDRRRCRTCSPAPSASSAPSARSSWCSATTTCCPPTSSTTAGACGWSTGTMAAGTAPCSTWAASPRTASWPRPTATGCWKPISTARSTTACGGAPRPCSRPRCCARRCGAWSPSCTRPWPSTIVAYTAENLARFERAWAEFEAMA